jgi:hypothetical protein
MPTKIKRLLSFCHAMEESSDDPLPPLDRESLLAVHKTLTALKDDVEQALLRIPLDVNCKTPRRDQNKFRQKRGLP